MEKITQKQIRNYPAHDLSEAKSAQLYEILKKGEKELLYYSSGTYGINGLVFTVGDTTYKIVGRTTGLFLIL